MSLTGDGSKIRIQFNRIVGESTTFTEGFVSDDGRRLQTFSIVPEPYRAPMSLDWQQQGLIPSGQFVGSVRKHLFYDEQFDILELRDTEGKLLGYYCDMVTQLQKVGEGEYALTDLILDLWVFPGGGYRELDRDQFDEAAKRGLISPELQAQARLTLDRLKAEAAQGRFPSVYIA